MSVPGPSPTLKTMKRSVVVTLVLTAVSAIFPVFIRAEINHGTDGTFCTAKGYLAFDNVELGQRGIATAVHLLKIFRFGLGRGIYFAGQASLPKTQAVSWMICGSDRVALGEGAVVHSRPRKCTVAFARRGEITGVAKCDYDSSESLSWSPPKVPAPYIPPALANHTRTSERAGDLKGTRQTPEAKLKELGGLSIFGPVPPLPLESADSEHTYPLESADSEHTYQLLRHLSDRPTADGVEWRRKCEIVQLDSSGVVLQRVVIYDGRRMEYAD